MSLFIIAAPIAGRSFYWLGQRRDYHDFDLDDRLQKLERNPKFREAAVVAFWNIYLENLKKRSIPLYGFQKGGVMAGRVCKWYEVCPIKRFYEQGELEKEWIEEYCKGDYQRCVRYWLEEKGEPHRDNLLPDGEIRKELK